MKDIKHIRSGSGHLLVLILILLFITVPSHGQDEKKKKPTKVHIISADQLKVYRGKNDEFRRLIGNVILQHDSVLMYCDSAHVHSAENYFKAFHNIKIVQGDSIYLYGDTLYYNGNTSAGRVRNNVRLIDKKTELTTNHLNFNMETNISHYFHGGTIIDSSNVLISDKGYYYSELEEYFFKDSVYVETPEYTVYSDTLRYQTEHGIVQLLGPSIIEGDTLLMYGENGYYNTELEFVRMGRNSYIESKSQTIAGDSLFFNQATNIGHAWENVIITDSSQHIIIKGNYAFFNDSENYSYVTDSAVFMQYEDMDTLYLHADTLFTFTDSSDNRTLRAYYKVKFYRYEMQGKCDSLIYATGDSLIRLFQNPVLWNEESQLTADYMQIHLKGQAADRIDMDNSAFIISKETPVYFNQIFGKKMTGFISNNELYKINVDGNAQTIYFPMDGEDIIGTNNAQSSNMIIYLKDAKVYRIDFLNAPEGLMNPMEQSKKEDFFLKGFKWLQNHRPMNRYDIFKWTDPDISVQLQELPAFAPDSTLSKDEVPTKPVDTNKPPEERKPNLDLD